MFPPQDQQQVCFIRTHRSAFCRVCGADNETGTYYFPSRPMGEVTSETEILMWPEGYVHYIIAHGQLPSRSLMNPT